MHKGENGCGAADAEGERQNRSGREDPRDPELSQRIAKFADECTHGALDEGQRPNVDGNR
jgi:hypothetical protein